MVSAPSPRRSLRRGAARLLLYGVPLALWMGVIWYGSGPAGEFPRTVTLLHNFLTLLTPEYVGTIPLDHGVFGQIPMHIFTIVVRRLWHVLAYILLAALVVRAVQGGRPRLRPASMAAAVVVSALYVAADTWHRGRVPGRHAGGLDYTLNLIGVATVLLGTVGWFALKSWERRLLGEEAE